MPLVVHVVPDTADAGAENQVRYLVEFLAKRPGWDVEIVYFRQGRAHDEFERLGVPLRAIPVRGSLPLDLYPRARELRSLYEGRPPAILHTWLYEANIVGAVAARAWRFTKLLVTQRSGSLERATPHIARKTWLIRTRADHAVANSREGLAFLHELGYPPNRTSLIRNGYPSSAARVPTFPSSSTRLEARRRLEIDPRTPVVGYVGRVHHAKDLGTLLGAMRLVWDEMPEAQLWMVGPSEEEVRSLEISHRARVRTTGWLPAPGQVVPGFDVLVSSSWTEGHSNSVCEALLAGVPVACTATGDHVSVVKATGCKAVPIRRPDLLADAVRELLRDPPDREAIAAQAAELLSMEPVVEATYDLYTRLLSPVA